MVIQQGRRYYLGPAPAAAANVSKPSRKNSCSRNNPNRRHLPVPSIPVRCTRRSARWGPGSCPICGMALEPEQVSLDDAPDPELADMTRRFWIALALTLPVFAIEMGSHLRLIRLVPPAWSNWISWC